MATSGGHLLVPKAMRAIRFVVEKATRIVREKLPQAARAAEADLQPSTARVKVQQPLNRVALIRQKQQTRWHSTQQAVNTTLRNYSSSSKAKTTRASLPLSRTARAVSQTSSRVPFASTLRPSLTGGTLCRSAGGYGVGAGRVGGARYFSHSPAAPAQVVSNVSQAVRAFWLSGQKARFDGFHPKTGEKRFRAISSVQEEAYGKMTMRNAEAPGSYLDFKVNPTITAIGPLSKVPGSSTPDESTLNCDGVMDMLAVDFARALKDLAAIMNDLKRLATLGDLPIYLENSSTLRVRFPGCDADLVEALCKELGIRRGHVFQDTNFESQTGAEIALLFPYAPSKAPSEMTFFPDRRSAKRQKRAPVEWERMVSPQISPGYSHQSATSHDFEEIEALAENPWLAQSDYSSLHESDPEAAMFFQPSQSVKGSDGFEGVEGIYRFIAECDRVKR